MAMTSMTLATVGVLSAILGILFQNGSLGKMWIILQDIQSHIPLEEKVEKANIHNSSYHFNFDLARELRRKNMKKFDFEHSLTSVDRRFNLTLEEFVEVYDSKWPVLIRDVVPGWEAYNWTADYFNSNYGEERVTMRAVHGSLKDSSGLALPLSLFLKNIEKSHERMWTYLEDELFISTRPQLKQHIGPCKYLEEDFFSVFPQSLVPWNSMMLWGTKYSHSSLHMDPYNWTGTNAVISGTKKWKLFPPGQDHLLYVIPGQRCGFPLECYKYNSAVDSFDVDAERYPLFSQAEYLEFEQRAGELLIIPTGWFHQAYNTEVTLAISSQVMNSQNYLVILEEIIKAGNIKRSDLPLDFPRLTPRQQVKTVASLLSPDILARGEAVTQKILKDIQGQN